MDGMNVLQIGISPLQLPKIMQREGPLRSSQGIFSGCPWAHTRQVAQRIINMSGVASVKKKMQKVELHLKHTFQ